MKTQQQPQEDWLEMIFSGRNKSYGAYRLRREANNDLLRSFLITVGGLALLLFFVSMRSKAPDLVDLPKDPKTGKGEITIEAPPEFEKPEQQQNSGSPEPQTLATVISHEPTSPLLNDTAGTANPNPYTPGPVGPIPGTGDGADSIPASPAIAAVETIQDYAEILPEYPGGEEALMNFLEKNTIMPAQAVKYGVEGKVIIQFVVEKDGSISNVSMVRGNGGYGMEEEAIRVVNKMPSWSPGMNNDIPVRVWYQIPFEFRLE